MHEIDLSPTIVERVRKRRGNVDVFERLEPRRTALLVVDMQNTFCMEGMPAHLPVARAIVPNINRLAAATRVAGGTVVWIRMAATAESVRNWSVFYEDFNGPSLSRAMQAAMTPGNEGFAFWSGLERRPEDIESVKTRFSAFIQGSSDLDAVLRARGIDTVIVTGTVTNVCCESTARDANMLNYRVVFVSDANAARSDEEHNATLGNLLNMFADIRSTDATLALLAAGAARNRHAG